MNILRTYWPIPLVVLAAAAAAVVIVLMSPWASERSAAEIVRDACVPDRLNGLDATLTVTRTTDAETKTRTYEYRMNNDAVHQVQYDADGNARREVFAFNDSRYYRREADSSGQWNAWKFRDTTNSQSSDLPVGSSDTFCGVENLVNIRDVGIEVVHGLSLRRYSAETNPDTLPDKWTETWDFWIDSNSRFRHGTPRGRSRSEHDGLDHQVPRGRRAQRDLHEPSARVLRAGPRVLDRLSHGHPPRGLGLGVGPRGRRHHVLDHG